jgi:hypothetical protein
MIRYLPFNVENRETLHNMGTILCVFGGVVLTYSIVSFSMFAKGISVLKFLFLLFSSMIIFSSGIILFVKSDYIAHKSVADRRWHYFVLVCPLFVAMVIIVLIEELYNCIGCVVASLVFLIVCVLFILLLLMIVHCVKMHVFKKPLEFKDLDNYSGFKPVTFEEEIKKQDITAEEKQKQVTERLELLSDKEFDEECKKLEEETTSILNEYINPVKIRNTDDQVHERPTTMITETQLDPSSSDDDNDEDADDETVNKNKLEY